MNPKKFNVLFKGPVINRSGYGYTADLLFHAFKSYPHFNLLCLPTPWGNCQLRTLIQPGDDLIKASIPKSINIQQPHIFIYLGLPHHEKPQGSIFNIGISAGVETSEAPDSMMIGLNQWDLNLTCSEFTKQVYLNSKVKPTKPIEVVPWSFSNEFLKTGSNSKIDEAFSKIPTTENFLVVGQITNGSVALDRKNIAKLIQTFCHTFKGRPHKPGLILKVNGVGFSKMDQYQTEDRLKEIKNTIPDNDVSISLLHGELNNDEMSAVYNNPKVIAHLSFSRGEGFGLPLLEASLSSKPIFAPNHSGHLDFLKDKFQPLTGSLVEIPEPAISEWFIKGSKWFEVDPAKASEQLLKFFYEDRTKAVNQAVELAAINLKQYTVDNFNHRIHKLLDKYLF